MISNATPLICLAKIGQLDLLKKLFALVTVPLAVKEEVLLQGKPEFIVLAEFFKNDWITIASPLKDVDLSLGKGETAAILLARERKDVLLIDDAYAIKTAHAFSLEIHRTTTIMFLAVQKKIITKNEAIYFIDKIIENGYYIAPQYYAMILKKLSTS